MIDLQEIIEKLKNSEVIDKNGYKYIILPFDIKAFPSDIRALSDALQSEITKTLGGRDFDKIVTIESKGILISTLIALNLNKPLYIIRKRSLHLPGEMKVEKSTGYEKSDVYINDLNEGDKIIIVDDLISTGGTLKAILGALQKKKCLINGIFVIFDKPDYGGSKYIRKNHSIPLRTLIKIKIKENNEIEVYL